ncbi:MAG: hypothetical protein IK016_03595 [Lachnospiraceae bacterium]|nr:hypothetical protein [Lachnospiraceae bacterium]
MKKNLLTILILATNIVTLAMVGIMMFSVMGTVNKSTELVNAVAAAIELEQSGGLGGGVDPNTVDTNVPIADQDIYHVNGGETLTITLTVNPTANGGDGRQHYAQVTMDILMNKSHESYAENSGLLAGVDSSIVAVIHDVIGVYNIDNIMENRETIRQQILQKLWGMFPDQTGTFIYNVSVLITPA